jgi:N-acetylglucosaminyl-diphospho-decaprenol L-rhamnosyltransferase
MEAVVVTHNSQAPLSAMLDSAATRAAFDRILVVDSASRDATRKVAKRAGVEVLAIRENRGFGFAANAGIAQTSGEFVAVLNPDIEVEHLGTVERLAAHFEDPAVGIVAPALRLPDGQVQDSVRSVPTPLNLLRRRLMHRRSGAIWTAAPADAAWVVGAAMFIRRAAFERVGGFDVRYLIYFEDVDLCVRLRRAGFRVRVDPGVVLAHQHAAASRRSMMTWSTRQHIRSAALFYARFPRYLLTTRE